MTREAALINAEAKLTALGPSLLYPHSSAVRRADRLRELRPRGGRSPWRALYRQIAGEFVVGAVGPEAHVDPQGFAAACRRSDPRHFWSSSPLGRHRSGPGPTSLTTSAKSSRTATTNTFSLSSPASRLRPGSGRHTCCTAAVAPRAPFDCSMSDPPDRCPRSTSTFRTVMVPGRTHLAFGYRSTNLSID